MADKINAGTFVFLSFPIIHFFHMYLLSFPFRFVLSENWKLIPVMADDFKNYKQIITEGRRI